MISWISENKEWLFSGIGISLALFLIKTLKPLFSIIKKNRPLIGEWRGTITQYNGLNDIEVEFCVSCDIMRKYDSLRAKGKIWLEQHHESTEEILTASINSINKPYVKGRLFKFDYQISNDSVIQFGNIFAELNAYSNQLKGSFIGFGATTEKIVNGNIILKKY